MGAIKLNLYSPIEIRMSKLARALSVPARITILRTCMKNEFVTGEVFTDLLQLSQPTIHHHLSILRDTGLIKGDFIGNVYGWSLSIENEHELDLITRFVEDSITKNN